MATSLTESAILEQSLVSEREPFDPLAALRTMGEVQRAGLEAAAAVVERILELGSHGTRMPYSFHLPAQPVAGKDSGGHEVRGADPDNDAEPSPGGRRKRIGRVRSAA